MTKNLATANSQKPVFGHFWPKMGIFGLVGVALRVAFFEGRNYKKDRFLGRFGGSFWLKNGQKWTILDQLSEENSSEIFF